MFLLLLLYALMALSFTFAKAGLAFASPIFFVGFRMIAAGLLLFGYEALASTRPKRAINWAKDWPWFALIVVVHIYLAYVLDLVALNYMSSFKAALIYSSSPFITAIFSYFFFNEKMNLRKLAGLTIGFIGFLPIVLSQAGAEPSVATFLEVSWPEAVMFVSVICSVWGWLTMRHLLQIGYTPIRVNTIGKLGGGLLALVTSFLFEEWNPMPVTDWLPFLYYAVLLIVLVNLIFYNLYGYLLTRYTATFLSFAGFLSPLFAALFGWLWLNEVIHWSFFISILFITIGLLIFYFEELEK